MPSLLDAVRQACSPAAWSRGVAFARDGSVVATRATDGELVLRITTMGGMTCPAVTLYPDDAAWECACASKDDACEHVAAAVIALQRAKEEGRSLVETRTATGHLRYCFTRGAGWLALERVVVAGEETQSLDRALSVFTSGRLGVPAVAATKNGCRPWAWTSASRCARTSTSMRPRESTGTRISCCRPSPRILAARSIE